MLEPHREQVTLWARALVGLNAVIIIMRHLRSQPQNTKNKIPINNVN